MITIPVPKDLSQIKSKVLWNLTRRQLLCFGVAAALGVPFYFLTKDYLGTEISALIMVLIMAPFFILAMYSKDGIPAEKLLYLWIKQKYIMPGSRPFESENEAEVKKRRGMLKRELRALEKKESKSISDRRRIRKIKGLLEGTAFECKLPTSAQKTIAFSSMTRDGICTVRPGFYTKMVEFYDMNYCLLDRPEREEVLTQYARLINYFDSNVKFQLFLFNRRVSKEELVSKFHIAAQGDAFDGIRKEFSGMLKKQSAKGTNGVIKSKYLIFGVEAKDERAARQILNGIGKDVIKNFTNIGAKARLLNGKERLRILHEYFHQDTLEPFDFSFKDLAESGDSIKDRIAPASFDFSQKDSFKMGKMKAKSFYVSFGGATVDEQMLRRILDIDANFSVSLHMENLSPKEAQRYVRLSLLNVQQSKIDEQKKAFRGGYDSDMTSEKLNEYETGAKDILKQLNESNNKLIRSILVITVFGKSNKAIDNTVQRISAITEQIENSLKPLNYLQEAAMNATAPIGAQDIPISRILNTASLSTLCPFNTQELFMEGDSLYYGINAHSNNMIMADRKKLRTPNGVILGKPGAGKSFSAKREIIGVHLVTKDDVIICDPEGEYAPLVNALGGQVIKLSSGSSGHINPMDIGLSLKNNKVALKIKSDFLITLCDLIAGGGSVK